MARPRRASARPLGGLRLRSGYRASAVGLVHGLRHAARRWSPSFRARPTKCWRRTTRSASRAGGEGGTTGAPPAMINAVVDALRDFGVRDVPMPATPERVWRAMRGSSSTRVRLRGERGVAAGPESAQRPAPAALRATGLRRSRGRRGYFLFAFACSARKCRRRSRTASAGCGVHLRKPSPVLHAELAGRRPSRLRNGCGPAVRSRSATSTSGCRA